MRALRFIAGAAAGFLVWWYATLFYDGALAFTAESLLGLDARLCGPHLIAEERKIEARPRLCVAPTATIPADQLTYNIILLAALFAMRWRSITSFLMSLFVVALTHVLSVVVSVESTYAGKNGAWSEKHYSVIEQHAWVSTEFFWRLVGMFAIVFACWWLTQAPIFPQPRASDAPRPKRAAAKGRR
jgi:hypothetical protein